jgi:hypothetical protein
MEYPLSSFVTTVYLDVPNEDKVDDVNERFDEESERVSE